MVTTVAALIVSACGERQFGMGIGRPPIEPVSRAEVLPLVLTEVFISPTVPGDSFAEIAAPTDTVSLSGLSSCSNRGDCVSFDDDSDLAAGHRRELAIADLDLIASAGHLVVVDDEGLVHAHLAWGADPSTLASAYWTGAVMSGVARPGEFVPLPFPFPDPKEPEGNTVAVVREGDQLGCAEPSAPDPADGSGGEASIDPLLCPVGDPALDILAVASAVPAGGDDTGSWVEIENETGFELQLFGVRICQSPTCAVLPERVLDAGALLRAHFGITDPGGAHPDDIYFEAAAPLSAERITVLAPGSADITDPTRVLSTFW